MDRRIIIVLPIVLAVLLLTPVAIYGTEVDVAQVSFDLSLEESISAATLSDLEGLQVSSFVGDVSNARVDIISMSTYEYILLENTPRMEERGEEGVGAGIAEITITFSLTTPNDEILEFVLSPGQSMGTGDFNIVMFLGPDEGIMIEGEFHLTITIEIVITPPVLDIPISDGPVLDIPDINITLEPVSLSFTIEKGQ